MMGNKAIRTKYRTSKQCNYIFNFWRTINKIHFIVDKIYHASSQKNQW